jgi:hypothetical protein
MTHSDALSDFARLQEVVAHQDDVSVWHPPQRIVMRAALDHQDQPATARSGSDSGPQPLDHFGQDSG